MRTGIASGEAIVHHVRDDVEIVRKTKKSDGSKVEARETVQGVADKRLLLVFEDLFGDFWPDEERVDDFLAAVNAWD